MILTLKYVRALAFLICLVDFSSATRLPGIYSSQERLIKLYNMTYLFDFCLRFIFTDNTIHTSSDAVYGIKNVLEYIA